MERKRTKTRYEEDDPDVETGEDVVDPGGLLGAQTEDGREEEGDEEGAEVGVGREVLDPQREDLQEELGHPLADQSVQVAAVTTGHARGA